MESLNKYYIFLKEQNIENYEVLKQYVTGDLYKLKTKENDNLMLIYNNEESNINEELVRFFNGVIIDKSNLRIVCYTLDKCYEETNVNVNGLINIDFKLTVQPVFEGALIRIFYANGQWNLSTKKMLDAFRAKWSSEKSFGQMFVEVFPQYLDYLKKDYCYSFLVGHKENNIIEINQNYVIHLNTIDLVNNVYIDEKINIPEVNHISQFEEVIEIMNQEELLNKINELKMNNEISRQIGYMFVNKDKNVYQKFIKNHYIEIRELWGNTNSRLFRYLHLRKNPEKLKKYLEIFNQDKTKLLEYENYLMGIAAFILNTYRNRYVSKTIQKIPFYMRDIIYKIHGLYLQTKNKVNFQDVNVILHDLDEKKFCYVINNIEKEKKELQASEAETKNESMDIDNNEN
jgi:hypothetical protein